MARNGAGTYVLPAGQPVVTGTTISSATHNTLATDLANALTTSIATDGQSVVTANIPFAGYKLTGVGAATVSGDALRFEDKTALIAADDALKAAIQVQTYTAFTTAGTSTAYTLTTVPAAAALVEDQRYQIEWHTTSGATPTLARDGLTAKNIKVYSASGAKVNPPPGSLLSGFKNDVVYDGTDYVVLGPVGPTDEIVNAQTGTTYTYLASDKGKLVTHTNGSAVAGTLPQAGASFPSGWWMDVQNRGAGALTITPTTSTIDGAASLVLSAGLGVRIASDGTNYFTQRGAGAADLSITGAKLSGGQTGAAPVYGIRAWVNFNGTGTVAIRASGNVSSITDNGAGDYTVNFTTAMPDADYATFITSSSVTGPSFKMCAVSEATPHTASLVRINVVNTGFALADDAYLSVTVVR